MNDPGLDEPISNDADDVENQQRDERDETREDEDAFLKPRYTEREVLRNLPNSIIGFANQ